MKALLALFVFIGAAAAATFAQEARGTWIARNSLTSKETLAAAIDSLAKNNFNTVYINVWSRGYPLWRSPHYFKYTGLYIDPQFDGRDILAETIAEAHKHGLHVEAWFEYGFVGWYAADTIPARKWGVLAGRPEWTAKKKTGEEIDNSKFFWMVQTRKDVQDFLIGLVSEMCRNYDIDGVELDRIRYSSTLYGYDTYTDSLYRAENGGSAPPGNENDAGWIRWRADKINSFMTRAYDSVKSISPYLLVSNAPSLYSSSAYTAYNDYCQDWVYWVNSGKVDYIQLQMYVSPLSTFTNIVNYALTLIQDKNKLIPAMAVKGGSFTLTNEETASYITMIRGKKLKGVAMWYYSDLLSYFPYLRGNVFSQRNHSPFTPPAWRNYYKVLEISDSLNAVRNGLWSQSALPGFSGASLQAASGTLSTIQYQIDVPVSGFYEVYVYTVVAVNRTDSARYTVHAANGNSVHYLDQRSSFKKRFTKLGDYFFDAGRRTVLTLSNEKVKQGTYLSGDAVYLSLNRHLSPVVNSIKEPSNDGSKKKVNEISVSCFPNPFNNQTVLQVSLNESTPFQIDVVDVLGRLVYREHRETAGALQTTVNISSRDLSSGMYFCTVRQKHLAQTIKLILNK